MYERLFSIEKRLQRVLELVRARCYSTPAIAKKLGVSVPTVSRDVTALRERGHDIRAERDGASWRYVLATAGRGPQADRKGTRTRRVLTA